MRSTANSIFLSLILLFPTVGSAQVSGFNGQRFSPAAGAAGGFVVERPFVPPHLAYGFGLFLNYADDPVVTLDGTDTVIARPLDSALGVNLLASVALLDMFELSLDLPFQAIYEGDPFALGGSPLQAGWGFGDIRLVPKFALSTSGKKGRYGVGLAIPVTFPTGSSEALRGDGVVTVEPKVLLGMGGRRFGVTVNAGIRLRSSDQPLGQELTFGGAAQYALHPRKDLVDLVVEGTASHLLEPDPASIEQLALELIAGVVFKPSSKWEIYLGGGPGLTDGLGAANYRIVAGVRFASRPTSSYTDRDGDGIPDFADKCPDKAEDYDGFEDDDGCPEDDNDHDGVSDDDDECPDEPGDRAFDGCPMGEVVLSGNQIVLKGKIQFETGSANLKSSSNGLLDQVAGIMREHPELKKVSVEGHTDGIGSTSSNQRLSVRRADSVRKALVERGIDKDRLQSRGHGESRPVAPNKTKAGRAKNRRVQFLIVD